MALWCVLLCFWKDNRLRYMRLNSLSSSMPESTSAKDLSKEGYPRHTRLVSLRLLLVCWRKRRGHALFYN
ncbi:hypothetical protein ACFX19_026000 [Malus domestica]